MALTSKLSFQLDPSLRKLGRWLLEQGVPLPVGFAASPLNDGVRLTADEHSFLFWLAIGHVERHSFVQRPQEDKPPCPDRDDRCRLAGAAHAILLGCDAVRDRKEIPHVDQLRHAFRKAQSHLRELLEAIDAYGENCKLLHEGKWKDLPEWTQQYGAKMCLHDHEGVCVIPHDLGASVRDLARDMRDVDETSLQSQYSSKPLANGFSLEERIRPFLFAEMQAALVDDGWRYEDVATMIDDGQDGLPHQIVDRIRKRIKAARLPRKARPSDASPPGAPDGDTKAN